MGNRGIGGIVGIRGIPQGGGDRVDMKETGGCHDAILRHFLVKVKPCDCSNCGPYLIPTAMEELHSLK